MIDKIGKTVFTMEFLTVANTLEIYVNLNVKMNLGMETLNQN